MQDYERDYMSYMQMSRLPGQYYPMMAMLPQQLEMMYPRVYHIIYPHVKYHCGMVAAKHGMKYTPTREHLDAMVDDIYRKVEVDVDAEIKLPREDEERQIGFGGRPLLRDLILILLIAELLRGRRPYGGYPGYYGGYPGYYGGY